MTLGVALLCPFAMTACTAIAVFAATILGALLGGNRPGEIKAHHLARKAVVYLRQSTEEQVQNNTGSTDYQRDQIRYPRIWGWLETLIVVIETDLGLSGAAPEHRGGYQQLVQAIARGEVGAIFLADLSRGGRNAMEWFRLLTLCQLNDTLIVVDGVVYDPNNSGDLLLARLLATVAEHENLTRRETMQRARLQKASKGHAVSIPPTGYQRKADGTWVKDSDPNVRAAIVAILRTFLQERSCSATLKALRVAEVKLPRRRRNAISWADPTVTKLYRILTNPAFAGTYRYRQTITDPRAGRDARGRLRCRRARADETIMVPEHHEPYIGMAEWQEIQAILKLNGPSEVRRNMGPGTALVQGFIRCGLHRLHSMVSMYRPADRKGRHWHAYFCIGDYQQGGAFCGRIAGIPVDAAVTEAILGRLTPPRLETIRAAMQAAAAGERSEQFRRKLERDRLRRDITVLEEKFYSLDPSSVEIAKDTEHRLETKKRELKQFERLLSDGASAGATLDDGAMAELVTLCSDLRTLWTAPTTTTQDRKQIARLLIGRVVLEHRTGERVQLRIEWADGGTTQVGYTTPSQINTLIGEMVLVGLTDAEIAQRLNDRGTTTLTGRPWTRAVVARKINYIRNGYPRRRRRDDAA